MRTKSGFNHGFSTLQRILFVGLYSLCTVTTFAADGPGISGGGSPEAAEFVASARQIYLDLNKNAAKSKQILGIDIKNYLRVVETTNVRCGINSRVKTMRANQHKAFYDSKSNTIYLDCERYKELKSASNRDVVTFHEYMRKLVNENSEYKVSAKLLEAQKINDTGFYADQKEKCYKKLGRGVNVEDIPQERLADTLEAHVDADREDIVVIFAKGKFQTFAANRSCDLPIPRDARPVSISKLNLTNGRMNPQDPELAKYIDWLKRNPSSILELNVNAISKTITLKTLSNWKSFFYDEFQGGARKAIDRLLTPTSRVE